MGANIGKEIEKAKAKEVNELDFRDRGITEVTDDACSYQQIPANIGGLESLIKLNLR